MTDARWFDRYRTLHAIGDVHYSLAGGGIDSSRPPIVTAGIAKATTPTVAATIHTGDCSTNGTTGEFALYSAFIAGLGSKIQPYYATPGNHDLFGGLDSEDAATALGMTPGPYAVDLGFVVLVFFMPGDTMTDYQSFSPTRLAALDALIAAQTKPVWLVTHVPLYNTVGALSDPALVYRSIDTGFFACTTATPGDSSDVLAMIAGHSNVKAWICGHTHSNLGADGFVTTVTLPGGRKIASINTSAIASVDRAPNNQGRYAYGGLNTIYVTSIDDNHIEVRARAHDGGGYWAQFGADGPMVKQVDLT